MSKKPKKPLATFSQAKPEHKTTQPASDMMMAETVATLKDLRKTLSYTQDDLAVAMGVGQGTISRIEKRHDMLVSTLQHYVESLGGTIQILATFPNRPSLVVERLGKTTPHSPETSTKKPPAPALGQNSDSP